MKKIMPFLGFLMLAACSDGDLQQNKTGVDDVLQPGKPGIVGTREAPLADDQANLPKSGKGFGTGTYIQRRNWNGETREQSLPNGMSDLPEGK